MYLFIYTLLHKYTLRQYYVLRFIYKGKLNPESGSLKANLRVIERFDKEGKKNAQQHVVQFFSYFSLLVSSAVFNSHKYNNYIRLGYLRI